MSKETFESFGVCAARFHDWRYAALLTSTPPAVAEVDAVPLDARTVYGAEGGTDEELGEDAAVAIVEHIGAGPRPEAAERVPQAGDRVGGQPERRR